MSQSNNTALQERHSIEVHLSSQKQMYVQRSASQTWHRLGRNMPSVCWCRCWQNIGGTWYVVASLYLVASSRPPPT
eukprot:scaffold1620_cov124-Skeletonema_menzelii.AAC.5